MGFIILTEKIFLGIKKWKMRTQGTLVDSQDQKMENEGHIVLLLTAKRNK